jgi:hypothetical protein
MISLKVYVNQLYILYMFVLHRILLCLPTAFTLVYYPAYFSTLKMEAICPSETPVDFQGTTGRYIPEDIHIYIRK